MFARSSARCACDTAMTSPVPTLRERLSLQGNPSVNDDWWTNPKTGTTVDFIDFCRSEGRFAKQFDRDGNPSALLLTVNEERLENWHQLQELAGII